MTLTRTAVLLATTLLVGSALAMQYPQQYHYYKDVAGVTTCDAHTCGINAHCTYRENRPVCACLNLHRGDPLSVCNRIECDINEDCAGNQICSNSRCVSPCTEGKTCGIAALCNTVNHRTICTCPADHSGDPFTRCYPEPRDPCKTPHICGANTECSVRNGAAYCKCLPGFVGSAIQGCRHECESDFECPSFQRCSKDFRCENPCLTDCGTNANCEVLNHRAVCTCPKNWRGNALVSCQPECQHHSECPGSKSACLYQKCVNPCDGVCGVNANCEIKSDGITPVCSCPRDRTGDPFTYCRLFEDRDLCEPNPCGADAICTPGHDNTGKKRPVCTCPHGYIGNALFRCQRGECLSDDDCGDHQGCLNFSCQNVCDGHKCGINASCSGKNHIAVCTCDPGTRGYALDSCSRISESRIGRQFGQVYRYQ